MKKIHRRSAFNIVELLIVITIIGVLLGLLLSAVQHAREAANRAICTNNLRQLGLALHSYHDSLQSFPPGLSYEGADDPYPFMAWSTRLLPFLEQSALWTRTQEAFGLDKFFRDNPPHLGLSTVLPVFACPSDPRMLQPAELGDGISVALTSYLGVEGTNQFREDGLLYLNSRTRFMDITDGASNTLLVGERPPSTDRVFGWWYGGWGQSLDGSCDSVLGARERNMLPEPGCPRGPYDYGPGNLRNQCDMYHFWGLHPGGGANFLFADGSVHFVPYSANPIMPALATRGGGESVDLPF